MIGCSCILPIAKMPTNAKGISSMASFLWAAYWAAKTDVVLFFGLYSEISEGQMPNKMKGSSDYLTISGDVGSETYQVPNTDPYIAADTDYIFFKPGGIVRPAATSELIGYDFERTIIKYDNISPNSIRAIMILKYGATLSPLEENVMRNSFDLSMWWDDSLSLYGSYKDNRNIGISRWLPDPLTIVNTVAWYNPLNKNGAVRAEDGTESIWWDMMSGKNLRSKEYETGTTVAYTVYEITACEKDYFYPGCTVGDIFPSSGGKTLSVNNKVKKVLGNHACQPELSKRPINGVFDGINDFMKTPQISDLIQPESIYMKAKQITYTSTDQLMDGLYSNRGYVMQHFSSPSLKVAASTLSSGLTNLGLGEFGVFRIHFNGTFGSFQINDGTKITGDYGGINMEGITIGCRGAGDARSANMAFAGGVFRKIDDTEEDDAMVYNLIK
jgi:hypothetical protein